MKTYRLSILVIAAVLLAISAFFISQQRKVAHYQRENEQLRLEADTIPNLQDELARLRRTEADHAELSRLRESQAAAQLELARIRAQAARATRAESDAASARAELERATAEADAPKGIAGPMADLVQGNMQQMFERRLAEMQDRLNLSPSQSQTIQDIFSRQAQALSEGMKGVYTGKMDEQRIAELRRSGDPEAEILSVLSPDQQVAYTALKEDRKINLASKSANGELLQMQHTIGIADDQMDKVFAILYDESLQRLSSNTADENAANPAEAMQLSIDRKLRALEGALTPAQLEKYRQQQELQLGFLRKVMKQLDAGRRRD
jgi:hypothetical protein